MSRASVLRSVLHKSHTEHSWYVLFLSLSLSLCLVDGRRRFLFGFSRGRNSSEFNAREDEEEKRSRDLRFRVARVRDIFLSFFCSPQFEDFIYIPRARLLLSRNNTTKDA